MQSTTQLEFKGTGVEYFKIWIVNLILSILTLGIYSAWATVRNRKYLYGNTLLDGSSFEYHASPITILKSRIIAVIFLIAYTILSEVYPETLILFLPVIALLIPWVVWRSFKFRAKMSSFRNVRFSFQGGLGQSYLYYLIIPIVIPFVLIPLIFGGFGYLSSGLPSAQDFKNSIDALTISAVSGFIIGYLTFIIIIPYVRKLSMQYYIDNSFYGQGHFATDIKASKFYVIYILALLILLGFGLILGVSAAILGAIGATGFQTQTEPSFGAIAAITSVAYLMLLVAMFWVKAYIAVKVRNYVYTNTNIEKNITLDSNLKTNTLFGIYLTNFLLVLFTLGLAYPWAKIRVAKYMVETIGLEGVQHLSEFVSQQQEKQSALGEEMGDAFDVDTGIDF